jgi:pimeloyl-ACP methyl ester carboxylesterase
MDAFAFHGDAMVLNAVSPDRPPSLLAFAAELPRAAWNAAALAFAWAVRPGEPRGDGRPVLVLPGLANTDRAYLATRAWLRRRGYRSYGWGLGRNRGARTIGADAERLIARIEAIKAETGETVTLVGVSLGGIMARIAAHRRPDLVREVITISSPFAGPATSTNVWRAFERLSGERITDPAVRARAAEAAAPLPVPATAIWSRSDGLVNGLICRDAHARCIEIRSSHFGVQLNPAALRALAQVLAESQALSRTAP